MRFGQYQTNNQHYKHKLNVSPSNSSGSAKYAFLNSDLSALSIRATEYLQRWKEVVQFSSSSGHTITYDCGAEHQVIMCVYHAVPMLDWNLTGQAPQLTVTAISDFPQPAIEA
jgi:hypothetical protein